jgi:hypothetical protein
MERPDLSEVLTEDLGGGTGSRARSSRAPSRRGPDVLLDRFHGVARPSTAPRTARRWATCAFPSLSAAHRATHHGVPRHFPILFLHILNPGWCASGTSVLGFYETYMLCTASMSGACLGHPGTLRLSTAWLTPWRRPCANLPRKISPEDQRYWPVPCLSPSTYSPA